MENKNELFDWNQLTLDMSVEYLRKKYAFDSSIEAKCIANLIDYYDKEKSKNKL